MRLSRKDLLLALSLLFAIALWGGNNTGVKVVVAAWPPVWTGSSRFVCAGLLMLAALKWTSWLGKFSTLNTELRRRLWWRGGLSLAVYIVAFNTALRYTAASHVALYLGAAPVWALMWETPNLRSIRTWQRYLAAALALSGVFILFAPSLQTGRSDWRGELLGLLASLLWTNYGRQCRALGAHLSGAEITAHTLWRAGFLLLPLSLIELSTRGLPWREDVLLIQAYCILFGGVVSFALWNNALRHWPASQVLLFNNLIPLSTMTWAHFWLREPITPTFGLAMFCILSGVILGQSNWLNFLQPRAVPPE